MADVRQVSIKGEAAHSYLKTPKSGRRTRRASDQAGGDQIPGMEVQRVTNAGVSQFVSNASKTMRAGAKMRGGALPPGSAPPNPYMLNVPAVRAGLAAGTVPPAPALALAPAPAPAATPAPPNPQQKGGKLILAPKRTSRFLLAPPRRTTKQTRKIRVQLSGLKKRITKARAIHKDSRDKSISEIRTLLEEAKLVKPSAKKVPEDVLRAIYKDYLLLRNKAL